MILAHLDDEESIEYAWAFWDSLEDLKSGDPLKHARAKKRLEVLRSAVDSDPERQVPEWALRK